MKKRTILIVDDEMAIRVMLRHSLERAGYQVEEVRSPNAASHARPCIGYYRAVVFP